MLEWLKNAVFGPKRREFLELQDDVFMVSQRVARLEGRVGSEEKKAQREAASQDFQMAIAEATAMLKEGKDLKEIAPAILMKHPNAAQRLMAMF